jgi:hypothetical protein
MTRKRADHILRTIADSLVAQDPNPLILGQTLIEVELVSSPPEQGGGVERLKSVSKELYDPLPGLIGGTSAAPVHRVSGKERLQVAVGVSQTEAPQVGLRHVKVMTQHPNPIGTASGVKELGGTVALDERLDRDHLKWESPNTPKHDTALLPGGLIGVVTDKAAIMLLHYQDPPGSVEECLLHHCGTRSLAPEDEDDRAPVPRRAGDGADEELGLRPNPPIDQSLIVSPVGTPKPTCGQLFGRQFGLAYLGRPDSPFGRGLQTPNEPHNPLDIRVSN